ncbi:hypothetical protein EYZ11_006297 [Aspergillus tanneri]|uniref:Uncharacterized protein n=1 Tax=Aspergillus tanneri TaxID=1220188 RepID=A0A4S3JFU1_9EURO|nr:hypothetical protein EYZ11_006297 [Aspergillus tanneri]
MATVKADPVFALPPQEKRAWVAILPTFPQQLVVSWTSPY